MRKQQNYLGDLDDLVPTPQAVRRQKRVELAKDGDPWAVYDSIRTENSTELDWDAEFERLHAALLRRAGDAPEDFGQEIISHLLATGCYFMLRTEFFVQYLVRAADARGKYRGGAYLPADVNAVYLPRLMELGRYVAEIAHIQAAADRKRELARAKRQQNEQRLVEPTPLTRSSATTAPATAASANTSARDVRQSGRPARQSRRQNGNTAVINGNGHAKHGLRDSAEPTLSAANRMEKRNNGTSGRH